MQEMKQSRTTERGTPGLGSHRTWEKEIPHGNGRAYTNPPDFSLFKCDFDAM
jgi:hypothetical protein